MTDVDVWVLVCHDSRERCYLQMSMALAPGWPIVARLHNRIIPPLPATSRLLPSGGFNEWMNELVWSVTERTAKDCDCITGWTANALIFTAAEGEPFVKMPVRSVFDLCYVSLRSMWDVKILKFSLLVWPQVLIKIYECLRNSKPSRSRSSSASKMFTTMWIGSYLRPLNLSYSTQAIVVHR